MSIVCLVIILTKDVFICIECGYCKNMPGCEMIN